MNHQLDLKTAAAYGRLLDFVPVYQLDDFRKRFEEFLDAYDADIKTEKTAPAPAPENVDKQRTIPKVGEIYSRFGGKIRIVAMLKDNNGYVIAIQAIQTSAKTLFNAVEFLPLSDFEQMNFTKEAF